MRILIMFSILLLFLIFYISKQLQHETYQGIHQTMDLYVQQLNKSMETAENCLWEFANNNTDVVDTITSKNNPNAVISQIKASRLLDNTLSYMTDIDGMFVYGKANDHFVCRYKNGGSNDCSSYMKKLLRQSGEDASALNFKSWYYIELERHTYLIRIINDLHGYLGAWIRLDELNAPFDDSNTIFLFADEMVFHTTTKADPILNCLPTFLPRNLIGSAERTVYNIYRSLKSFLLLPAP